MKGGRHKSPPGASTLSLINDPEPALKENGKERNIRSYRDGTMCGVRRAACVYLYLEPVRKARKYTDSECGLTKEAAERVAQGDYVLDPR